MRAPLDADRLLARERPGGWRVMRQRWSNLLFLHWRMPAEQIQATLPAGLYADTFGGDAWVGIVPFHMERIRPSGLPAFPGVSWFLELNVRTYVHDDNGVPGVWFYSLDCNQPLAVEVAHRFFHLPYCHALMSAEVRDGRVDYQCRRETDEARGAGFSYDLCRSGAPAEPGTLEFFLVERYLLYSANEAGSVFRGRVFHPPYRIAPVACREWSTEPARLDGLVLPDGPPQSILGAEPVDVNVFPLTR